MPRPTTKTELINTAAAQFEKMWAIINTLDDEGKNAAFNFDDVPNKKEAHWERDKNLRDVLIHLFEWHQLLLSWVAANQNGEAKPFLPEPYNWKTYGQMNIGFWEKHQSTALPTAITCLNESHAAVLALIGTFSDEELFVKKQLLWTGGSTLGSYCVSATGSHYDWAIKKIKYHIKFLGN